MSVTRTMVCRYRRDTGFLPKLTRKLHIARSPAAVQAQAGLGPGRHTLPADSGLCRTSAISGGDRGRAVPHKDESPGRGRFRLQHQGLSGLFASLSTANSQLAAVDRLAIVVSRPLNTMT